MKFFDFWSLKESAFEENASPKFFYESTEHREALDRLRYVIDSDNMNIGLLTGEIGAGKTMSRNVLKEELLRGKEHNFVVSLDTSDFRFIDIMKEIVVQLTGLTYNDIPANKYAVHSHLKQFLKLEVIPQNKRVFIFFDEAQKIKPADLDALKDLTNISFDYKAPITLIFIGQPDLLRTIKKLPQIDQRISMRYHLNHMTKYDTMLYVKHRLEKAGCMENIISQDAIDVIYSYTDGVPREINRACRIALDYGFSEDIDVITRDEILPVFKDIANQEKRMNV
jgi:general secretion pathway protein A